MPAIDRLSNSTFANAIKVLGRSSQRSAAETAARVDRLPDHSRRLGQEHNLDGYVSRGEMYEFARLTYGTGQGMSPQEKRLGDAARILHEAMFIAQPQRLELYSNAPRAQWRKEVPLAGLSGKLEVRNALSGELVLEGDRKKLAQRIAGPGQPTIGFDDFQKALPFLTPNECYLANALLNELYFSQPLGTHAQEGSTPGGRPLRLETTHHGEGQVPTGGLNPAARGSVGYAIGASFTVELTLKSREVVVNTQTGETHVPDRSGKVRFPVGRDTELAIVTRGATGEVKEKLQLRIEGGNAEGGLY